MPIGATCIWEVRTTGSNTNGGGYTSGGTDYSQQDAAQYALTGVTSEAAGNTVLSASAVAAMVGNIGCCVSGTNFTTSEFFEVASVSVGVSITFGTSHAAASISTGVGANGVINIGGAFKIGGTLDDDFFDSVVAGNTVYIQTSASGVTYTLGEAVSMASSGTAPLPITFEAYITARGTKPTGVDRPIIASAANSLVTSGYVVCKYLIFTSTGGTNAIALGNYNVLIECKAVNTNTGAVYAFYGTGTSGNYYLVSCEGICRTGTAFEGGYAGGQLVNCYFHDSSKGIVLNSNTSIFGCIIDTCVTGITTNYYGGIYNNTIRNCVTGISGGAKYVYISANNSISDCVTGALWTTNELINVWKCNNFYNTTDNTLVTLDSTNLVASNPLLGSGLVSGTDGVTSASGLVFTAVSAPFSGVTTSDCLLIKATGTGATVGVYIISSVDSTSQLTISTSAGASKTGITYGIVKGADFTLGAGSPCFDAGLQPSSVIGIT